MSSRVTRTVAEYGISGRFSIPAIFMNRTAAEAYHRAMRIRIVVANIQSGIGVTRNYRQYLTSGWRYLLPHDGRGVLDAGTFLKAEDADIALLTEVDGGSRRSRNVSQMDRIVEGSGLANARFFSTRSVGTSINEGNAIVTRFPVSSERTHPLPSHMNPRVLGETVLQLTDGRTLTALVAHLALGGRQRELQLAEIAERVKGIEGPVDRKSVV